MTILNIDFFKKNIVIISFLTSLFFSHSVFFSLQLRFIFLFCIFFSLYEIIKKKQFPKILVSISIIIVLTIFLHSYLYLLDGSNNFISNVTQNDELIKTIFQCIVIFLTSLILYYVRDIILSNFDKLILYYLIILTFLLLILQFKNEINILSLLYSCNTGLFSITKSLYLENSHFHIISVPIILYSIFNYEKVSKNLTFLFLIILFTIFSFGLFSLTFYLSINLGIFFIFCTIRKIKKVKYLLLILLLLVNNLYFFNKTSCEAIDVDYFEGKIMSPKDKLFELKKAETFLEDENIPANLSIKVYLSSLLLAKSSIEDNFIGVGLNNYSNYFLKINESKLKNSPSNYIYHFNISDGSNNFSKIVVEFGIIGIFLILFLFFKSFTIAVSDPIKIFLYTSLIIQLIVRGAGYFNNGFFIIIIILLMIIFKKKINVKKLN